MDFTADSARGKVTSSRDRKEGAISFPAGQEKSKENGMVVYLGKQDGKKSEQKESVIETTGRKVKNEK